MHNFGRFSPLFPICEQTDAAASLLPHSLRTLFRKGLGWIARRLRVALGLVLLAGMIATPLALISWITGFATAGEAALIYLGSGFSVLISGFLSTGIASLLSRPAQRSDTVRVRVDVKLADRS
jgi:hypothetical protein